MLTRGWQVVCALLAVGCAGELRDPGRFSSLNDEDSGVPQMDAAIDSGKPMTFDPTPACVIEFFKRCNTAACHEKGASQVDLLSAGVEQRVVGKPSLAGGACKNRTLVATDGTDSLLLDKLKPTPPCGLSMPYGRTPASDAEVTCLSDWIDSLASDN